MAYTVLLSRTQLSLYVHLNIGYIYNLSTEICTCTQFRIFLKVERTSGAIDLQLTDNTRYIWYLIRLLTGWEIIFHKWIIFNIIKKVFGWVYALALRNPWGLIFLNWNGEPLAGPEWSYKYDDTAYEHFSSNDSSITSYSSDDVYKDDNDVNGNNVDYYPIDETSTGMCNKVVQGGPEPNYDSQNHNFDLAFDLPNDTKRACQ